LVNLSNESSSIRILFSRIKLWIRTNGLPNTTLKTKNNVMEKQGIDPCTLRMLSEYSTI
jgi:hypothetical protein